MSHIGSGPECDVSVWKLFNFLSSMGFGIQKSIRPSIIKIQYRKSFGFGFVPILGIVTYIWSGLD